MSIDKSKKKYLRPVIEDLNMAKGEEVGSACRSGNSHAEHCEEGAYIRWPQGLYCHYGDHAEDYCNAGNVIAIFDDDPGGGPDIF